MELTWIAIIASLLMGIGALLFFIFAVKQDYFRNLEDTKYQVFWSELEELVESSAADNPAPSLLPQNLSAQNLPAQNLEDHQNGSGQESQRFRT